MPTVKISRIHTTLKISLLLQTKVTKNCYYQVRFLGSNTTEMRWRKGLGIEGDEDRGREWVRKEEKWRWGRKGEEMKKGECNVAQWKSL